MNTAIKNRPSRGSSRLSRQNGFSNSNRSRGRFVSGQRKNNTKNSNGRRQARKISTFDPSRFINTNPSEVTTEVYTPKNNFNTFGLSGVLVKAILNLGLDTPSPIQDQIIPEILNGRDVIGIAETGTGKTAAFLIPILEKTLKNKKRQTLILAPTRELALQINEELYRLSRGLKIYSTICVGGMNIRPQIKSLCRNNHFIIGTPGRVLDLIKRKDFKPEMITTVVLDEADRMLDMGFIKDIKSIVSSTPKERETFFFSATMSKGTEGLVNDFLRDPITISVKKKDVTNSIEQDIVRYKRDEKYEVLTSLLKNPEFKRVIIFGSMKHSVEKLSQQLSKSGIRSESIHGNKGHSQRQRALKNFKNGESRVLVATDVASRGIHVDDVTHVINYDLPTTFEDYVHRIGRTGRCSKHGKALTFISV
jgi:superfamily II DNA/RNA helicase